MKKPIYMLFVLALSAWISTRSAVAQHASTTLDRIQLTLDASEAERVLEMLALRSEGKSINKEQWQKLFATEPYQRLKKREIFIGQYLRDTTRVLTDEKFKAFVLSDKLLIPAPELQATLDHWKQANLRAAAESVLRYLPDFAMIRAKIYPTIKPQHNSFVWEVSTDPAIFLYLDPTVTSEQFTNTVGHELHHIGLSSVSLQQAKATGSLDSLARIVAQYAGAFGEGMAMLAAAGGPDIHPHAVSPKEDRERWDNDMKNFNSNLLSVDSFFVAIFDGKFKNEDAIQEKGFTFFGIQGAWYTVGYNMSVLVEKKFGRAALIQTMLDPRQLLALYNRIAKELNATSNERLALWSENVLKQVGAE